MLLLFLGCSVSSYSTGLLTDLTAFALVAEPVHYVPGSPLSVEVTTANPDRLDVELLVWTVPVQADGAPVRTPNGQPWSNGFAVVNHPGLTTAVDLTPHEPALAVEVLFAGMVSLELWALVCEVDACPIIDTVRTGGFESTGPLADPMGLSLPFHQSSLALHLLELGDPTDPETWGHNPTVTRAGPGVDGEVLQVDRGSTLQVDFAVDSAVDLAEGVWLAAGVGGPVVEGSVDDEEYGQGARFLVQPPEDQDWGQVFFALRGWDGGVGVDVVNYVVVD